MRLVGLDIFRGYAIILMVIFHFSFDINHFDIVEFDIRHGLFWNCFRYVIVSLFIFSAGMSIYLANKDGVEYKKIFRRVFILSIASLLVTIGSYSQFPNSWIYFGILHFFLFSSIVGLLFLKVPKISFILGLFLIVGDNFEIINMHWLFTILQAPLHLPINYTEDLASIIPWFGVFLLGISFSQTPLIDKIFNNTFFNSKNRINTTLDFLGKHSLVVYLVHQPILFTFFYLVKQLGIISPL